MDKNELSFWRGWMKLLPWFHLHFIENPGMAWGWKFGNETGKIVLTLFRLAAVIFGTWYLGRIVKNHYHKGFIVCAALIYAGALGNLIDSMFYGMIFDKGYVFVPALKDYHIVFRHCCSFHKWLFIFFTWLCCRYALLPHF